MNCLVIYLVNQSIFNYQLDYFVWDEFVLSKTVLLNFCPKQVNEWIGGPRASLFQLFIAFLTWPNLTCLNRPLSPFFHHLTPPGWPLIWQFFLNLEKWTWKGGGSNNWTFSCFPNLNQPNLLEDTTHSIFHHLTPPVGGASTNFRKNGFRKNDLVPKESLGYSALDRLT